MPDLLEKLLRRHKERVLIQASADNGDRVCAQNVDCEAPVQEASIIRANHGMVVAIQHIVCPRLLLDPVVQVGPVFENGFGVGNQACEWEAESLPILERFLKRNENGFLVEAPPR